MNAKSIFSCLAIAMLFAATGRQLAAQGASANGGVYGTVDHEATLTAVNSDGQDVSGGLTVTVGQPIPTVTFGSAGPGTPSPLGWTFGLSLDGGANGGPYYGIAPGLSIPGANILISSNIGTIGQLGAASAFTPAIATPLAQLVGTPTQTGLFDITIQALLIQATGSGNTVSPTFDYFIRVVAAPAPAAPGFTQNPASVTVSSGHTVVFNAVAGGVPAPTYQWNFNSAPISGATDPILEVPAATSADAGTYSCTASNASGSVTSAAASLTVATSSTSGRLINLSARANVGTGNNILIGGFGVGGTGTKQLLVRGAGPALAVPLGGSGELATPQLTLLDNAGLVIASDIGWGNPLTDGPSAGADSPQLASGTLMDSLGAAAYTAGSADTATVLTAPAGNGTAEVSGVGGANGIALVEFYDADTGTPAARLINISARADVGTGNNILIGGFVIGGSTAETVLIRAVGPGLVDSDPTDFSLATVLNQPVLTLLNSSGVAIYSNTVWGGDATIASVFPTVGAFGLNSAHQDSALLVTLPPGNYTAEVGGLNSGTGIALCEIYEVP